MVRLVPSTDEVVRRLPEWSTAAHRALEDRLLGLLDRLGARTVDALPGTERVLEGASRLGEDQVAAVRVLCGPGGSVRCVLAPAGFGKTAMVHAAAAAAVAADAGRSVIGAATTSKAVAELEGAGLPSTTIAHLRTLLATGSLTTGTVVVLDEVSQTSTRDAEVVLAAVAAAPGAQVWVLGDARQGQPVLAGGLAHELSARAGAGVVPAATLTVNRRQTDPDDRRALTLLRSGKPVESQAARDEHGWEHQAGTPEATREAMADAVVADIDTHGPEQVVALTVSHGDAEDLVDRIRGHLIRTGRIRGQALTGPGWTTPRDYQVGDRVLFHTRYGPRQGGLVNGTTGTVLDAGDRGLTVAIDGAGDRRVELPAEWVQGARMDGSPNLSHAWARTVDGAQGGTWEAAHLLGTPALDAFRGYVGQSRSRQPTHTWNTTLVIDLDHGGRVADSRTPDEHVLVALARTPGPRLAAVTDPHPTDRRLRIQIAAHLDVLNSGPPDRTRDLGRARQALEKAERKQTDAGRQLARVEHQRDGLGPLGVLRSQGRSERRRLDRDAQTAADRVTQTAAVVSAARHDLDSLVGAQRQAEAFAAAEGWRRLEINRLREQLAEHWSVTIVSCARSGDPLARTDRLRHAAHHRHHTLQRLEASIPTDRSAELNRVSAALDRTTAAREDAASRLAPPGPGSSRPTTVTGPAPPRSAPLPLASNDHSTPCGNRSTRNRTCGVDSTTSPPTSSVAEPPSPTPPWFEVASSMTGPCSAMPSRTPSSSGSPLSPPTHLTTSAAGSALSHPTRPAAPPGATTPPASRPTWTAMAPSRPPPGTPSTPATPSAWPPPPPRSNTTTTWMPGTMPPAPPEPKPSESGQNSSGPTAAPTRSTTALTSPPDCRAPSSARHARPSQTPGGTRPRRCYRALFTRITMLLWVVKRHLTRVPRPER